MGTVTSAAPPAPPASRSLRLSRMSDELLARQAGRGSERAFAALYERYHQQLYRYCRSIVRHDADAQDVLQATFTAALSALRRERRNAPLRPWLYRIAHNEAITLLRRRSRESDRELTEAVSHVVSSAEDQAADRARFSTLVAELAGLPERQRSALVMRELSGLSHEEIALALGTGVGGAKQAIFEARQALAQSAEGRAMSCDEVRLRLSAGDRRVLRGRRVRAHLHDCRGCEAFAAAISGRRAELRALTPVLPASAAAAVLSRSLGAASTHGASGAAAGSTAASAGAVGKAAGTAVMWKAATGVAVLATAAAGVSGLEHVLRHGHGVAPSAAQAAGRHAGAATKRPDSAAAVNGAASSAAAHAGSTPTAGGIAGHGHSPSRAGASAAAPAGLAYGVARHGRTPSHGGAATTAPGHAGSAGKSATHSNSTGRAHAPAAHGGAAGHIRGKSGTAGSASHTSTAGHARTPPTQSVSGATVTVTTPGKTQTQHGTAG